MATNWQEVEVVHYNILPPRFGSVMYKLEGAELTQRQAEFKQWLKRTDTFYYARPRESFFVREAMELAAEAGNKRVLVEDMS